MLEKPNAPKAIGLEIQNQTWIAVSLSLKERKPHIDAISQNVKQLYTDEEFLLVSVLPASEVLMRILDVKLKKEKDIDATLPFLAEPLLPYPIQEALLDKIILSKNSEETKICILAVRKDRLQNHLATTNGFDPEVVSAPPIALAAFANHYFPQETPDCILHLGQTETTCVLLHQNLPLAAQTATTLLAENVEKTLPEISRMFFSLQKQFSHIPISRILLTGPGAQQPQLIERLQTVLQKDLVHQLDPHLLTHALSIGAAITALQGYKGQVINFRKEEFTYPKPWKRYRKMIASYLALSLVASVALFLFSKAYLNYQEKQVKQEYVNLLADFGKTYNAFEHDTTNGVVTSPKQLTLDNLTNRLSTLESQLKQTPDLFPLQHNVPYVSDLIAWISTHPIVKETGMTLESLSYTMIKRPDNTKRNEKYRVKVELEFSSPTPKQAREFHDALIADNEIIDSKEEVKWSSNRGKFRTSFFLKDKTNYRNK